VIPPQASEPGSTAPDPPGKLRAAISNAIVRLYSDHYGKGPTKCRTFMFDDLIVSVLEDTFTTVERMLAGQGRGDSVREVRTAFQAATEERFRATVEELTGRPVRSLVSAVDVEHEIAYEVFLLAPSSDGDRSGDRLDT
jgi:uncharacterized protein YbcI